MREADYLREQARECRNEAGRAASQADRPALRQLSEYYEREARRLEAGAPKAIH